MKSVAERDHDEVWESYISRDAGPDRIKIILGKIISRILGDTFTIKFLEKGENFGVREFQAIEKEIPEAYAIVQKEEEHENRLMAMVSPLSLDCLQSHCKALMYREIIKLKNIIIKEDKT